MQQFNLDTWLQDKSRKVVTRDGRSVRIICTDAKSKLPIIALVPFGDSEDAYHYNKNGVANGFESITLFFADEEEELTEFEKQVSHFIASAINKEHEYNRGYVKWAANALLNYAKHELEKQGEQNPADKIEPKFKVGDWCIDNEDSTIFQIAKVLDNTYTYKTNEGEEYSCTHHLLEKDSRLWTIQDAKDGDVLVLNGEVFIYAHRKQLYSIAVAHCFVDNAFSFYFDGEFGYTEKENSIHPATNEQRNLLFQKMNETGYEWDAEKKELKKIKQKPAWSEEDEKKINGICFYLMCSDSPEGYTEWIDYLKSLKDRISQPHWKPSKEQLRAIINSVQGLYQCKEKEILLDLYEQLKTI